MLERRAGVIQPEPATVQRLSTSLVVCDPETQSGPRRLEVPRFVAPGNGKHEQQRLSTTCGVTVALLCKEANDAGNG